MQYIGGVDIDLPDNQNLDGFDVNGDDTVFTVPVSGTYLVTYQVNVTVALLMSTRILVNGSPLAGSLFSPAISVSSFTATTIAFLNDGDELTLQFFGIIGAATLQGGAGATLTVVRLA